MISVTHKVELLEIKYRKDTHDIFNTSAWKEEAGFSASLSYEASFRITKVTQRDPALTNQKTGIKVKCRYELFRRQFHFSSQLLPANAPLIT